MIELRDVWLWRIIGIRLNSKIQPQCYVQELKLIGEWRMWNLFNVYELPMWWIGGWPAMLELQRSNQQESEKWNLYKKWFWISLKWHIFFFKLKKWLTSERVWWNIRCSQPSDLFRWLGECLWDITYSFKPKTNLPFL